LLIVASLSTGARGLLDGTQPPVEPVLGKVEVVGPPEMHRKVQPDLLAPFRGLSTWIDTYDTALTAEQQVAAAHDGGVNTIFVQASRPSTEGLIHDADRLARTIDLAHDLGMSVMVWTVPDFEDLDRDRAQAIAAMEFTTARGDRADAFGLDIEVEDVDFVPVRTRRLLQLSEELRAHAGPAYPMAAIVLPPLQLQINTTWWPKFPYVELAALYDVTMPMSYSSYRGTDAQTTLDWNRDNATVIRQIVGDPDLPIHLAGGIADSLPEVTAFVRAAVDADVIGAGLYDLHTTRPEAWPALRALRYTPEPS
jgi:hypothetical protein